MSIKRLRYNTLTLATISSFFQHCTAKWSAVANKIIVCKSCGELSLSVQCSSCAFGPAREVIFKNCKITNKTKCFSAKLLLIKVQKINEFKSPNQLKSHKKRSHHIGMTIPQKIWFLEEWQFNIPHGSRKIKSIPQDPRGILGCEIFLNLPQCCMLINRKFKISFQSLHKYNIAV